MGSRLSALVFVALVGTACSTRTTSEPARSPRAVEVDIAPASASQNREADRPEATARRTQAAPSAAPDAIRSTPPLGAAPATSPAGTAAPGPPPAVVLAPSRGVSVRGDRVDVGDPIVFEMGTSFVRSESDEALSKVKAFLELNAAVTLLRVEGHTDSDGDDAENLRLSGARALACVEWLVAGGIARERLLAVGFGEHRPIAPNDSPLGRTQNRRMEFRLAAIRGAFLLGRDPSGGGMVFR